MPNSSDTSSPSGPLALLLISDQPEEIKGITMTMRGFYPGTRVETVYTPEEALEWASKQAWDVILLDDRLPRRSGREILPEIRQRAMTAAIIFQTEGKETAAALDAMRAGADFALFIHSPSLLAELPLITREVLEKRSLRAKLDHSDRYRQLVEDLTDLVYELDAEGRFVFVSPRVVTLLGYRPEELIGRHYSTLFQPLGEPQADRRLHERRTGSRATRHLEVRLMAKGGAVHEAEVVEMELATAGLYSGHRQFLGSVGVARDITKRKRDQAKLERLEQLGSPLASIQRESELLLERLRDLQLEHQLQLIASQATHVSEIGRELLALIKGAAPAQPNSSAPSVEIETPSQLREPGGPARGTPTAGRSSEIVPPVPESLEVTATADQQTSTAPAAPVPPQERRRAPRLDLEIEAHLGMDGTGWEGRVVNMSLCGLYMLLTGAVDLSENQPIQLGLGGEGGILEIRGKVRALRSHTEANGSDRSMGTGVAVDFGSLGAIEERILSSILEGIREQAITLKLTGLLIPQQTEDLLVEVAGEPPPPADDADRGSNRGAQTAASAEHRMTARINVVMPASLAVPGTTLQTSQSTPSHSAAQITNLSVGGACVRVEPPQDLLGRRILMRLSPSAELMAQARQGLSDLPRDFACTVMGEVVWVAPDANVLSGESLSGGAVRMGIRFLHLKEESRRRISALVGQLLTLPGRVEPWSHDTSIVSELTECQSLRGQRIAIYHDHPRRPLPPAAPVIIIAPGYGETKREYIALAYYFASNGFHVLRYDHSNHVGESEGDLTHTSLSGMKDDLTSLLGHAQRVSPAGPIAVMAVNLSARAALKTATEDPRIKLLLLVAGVVDVQATLQDVHQDDYVASHAQGIRRGVSNLLGLNVDTDRWLADAIKHGYADLRTTLRDAAHIQMPVVWCAPEHDGWVRQSSVKEVQAALGAKLAAFYPIAAASQRLHDNGLAGHGVFQQVVTQCRRHFYALVPETSFQQPVQREIDLQKRIELERSRALHQMGTAESIEFWRDYLAQFHYIANFPDYWHLLEQIYGLVGASDRKERILDAGCGNGNFGMFLLINKAYRQQVAPVSDEASEKASHYVGVDFVSGALAQTRSNIESVSEDLQRKFPSGIRSQPLIRVSLVLTDLNLPLPFKTNQFEGIVCNLVIGYLQDPLFVLRELVRVLEPKGKLVLTNLKPDADFTQIYRNFMPSTPEAEPHEIRQISVTSGKIQQAQRDGIFRSFDRQALARLLMSSGAVQPRIYSAFANQAFIAVAEKAAR
jgi:PAS domain S-box-containing protein